MSSNDLKYALAFERKAIEDEGLDFGRFRRLTVLRLCFVAEPTEVDKKAMSEVGSTTFRVKLKDLQSTQCYVNIDTVAKYTRDIRQNGASDVSPPYVELVKGNLVVVDGYHRIEAFRRLGRKSVAVRFHPSNWHGIPPLREVML